MNQEIAVDLTREAIWLALILSAPILVSGVAVGLVTGLFQALTQIQEQTIGIVLKLIVMVLVTSFLLSWITIKMIEYSHELYTTIPDGLNPFT
ncbi:MAG: flagellar biosynthetic protein FliQ [Planctomycetaceae bacterium]|jgi:flagellar biosynthetic protein FliQ|nr:flagellar biosynthetic protein FliQ [Planctomycetaceae bacterium]